jgi:hypothetical protein
MGVTEGVDRMTVNTAATTSLDTLKDDARYTAA